MNDNNDQKVMMWKIEPIMLALLGGLLLLLVFAFADGLEQMVLQWGSSEEYGYGYMIPVLTAFFIWQLKNELAKVEFTASWLGVGVLLLAGVLLVIGDLATLFIIVQYAFLLALFGFALAVMGWRAFKMILPAMFLLIFMIPLPNFLYQGLSAELQLISSRIGVEVIRLFGISVFLEGNVIDLGSYKLQVVEACSGLRYLFPLAALSYIAAYLFKGPLWQKAVIFLSSMPITVLMNSFRIGVIGVLVEYWGSSMAEGFLHDFEGWVVFMACMLLLVLEMWLLSKIGRNKLALADAFEITLPESIEGNYVSRPLSKPFLATMPVVLVLVTVPFFLGARTELIPERETFAGFSMDYPGWQGRQEPMEQQYIDVLKFDDYVMSNYTNDESDRVNFYVAYYASQRKGASVHSPKSCIPGGGWKIAEHQTRELSLDDGSNLPVNRLLIQNGSNKQLVYYWFDQRGRKMTNEYAVKWYLFWDALTRNRTDGSLVRAVVPIKPGEDVEASDEILLNFVNLVKDDLPRYIPK